MSAETADNAGTPQLKQFLMVSIKEFPRGINSDQVISGASATASVQRAPGPGLKQQAIEESVPYTDIIEAQASSDKQQATDPQASSGKHQAPSCKHQASSRKRQAL